MGDADHDNKADRVTLTYSEDVKHAVDIVAPFPLSVAGYTVTKVNALTAGRKLVVILQEQAASDLGATPAVTYTQTTSRPVKDIAGNQARNQTFSALRRLTRTPTASAGMTASRQIPTSTPAKRTCWIRRSSTGTATASTVTRPRPASCAAMA